jgi:hypothetical protein
MSCSYEQYVQILDALRVQRSLPEWAPPHDRELLSKLEEAYDALSEDERKQAEAEAGRSWPGWDRGEG